MQCKDEEEGILDVFRPTKTLSVREIARLLAREFESLYPVISASGGIPSNMLSNSITARVVVGSSLPS